MNILIVIDEPRFRQALDSFLRTESVEPVVVASLDEARALEGESEYHLVFVSEALDGLSLVETRDAARSLPGAGRARIVAVTPSRTPALRALYEAGYDAVVGPGSTADEIAAQAIIAERWWAEAPLTLPPEPAEEPAVAAEGEATEGEPFDGQPQAVEPFDDELPVTAELAADRVPDEAPPALSPRASEILSTLKTLGFYLAHGANAERQARHALQAVNLLLPDSPCAIWLRPDDESRGLVLVPGPGLHDDYPSLAHDYYARLSDEQWEELAGGSQFITRERGVTGPLVSLFIGDDLNGALHVGLVSSERVLGLLAVYFTSPEPPDAHDIIALETIASMTAVAMTHELPLPPVETLDERDEPDHALAWERAFELIPTAAFLSRGDGLFVSVNRALREMSGTNSELGPIGLLDLLEGHDATEATRLVAGSEDDPRPHAMQATLRRADGGLVPVSLTLHPLEPAEPGAPRLTLGVLREAGASDGESVYDATLRDIAHVIAYDVDVYGATWGVLDALSSRLGYGRACVWELSDDGATLWRLMAVPLDGPESLPVDDGAAGRAAQMWTVEVSESGGQAFVPVTHDDRMLGVLEVGGRAGEPITWRETEFLKIVATQIAGIIERSRLISRLEHQATTDQVTGLPNRQAFQERLDAAVASTDSGPVSVLVLGVDGFKAVNELYGHAIADDVLRQIGEELAAVVAGDQMLARYTSDQFVALLPGVNRDAAVSVAENMRIAVGTHLFTVAEQVEQLTVSIGAATFPDDAGTAQALLQAADHAMYLAKRAGRNQTFQSNAAFATLAPAHGRINDLLRQSPRETLSLLIRAMDQRLPERAGHSERVTRYALAIAREMGVPDAELPGLRLASYIHDIGMVSLPDSLLRKPSQLSAEERGLLRGVPVAAHGLLSQLDMPESVLLSVLHQRENYDGSGYPTGLQGDAIPLGARIIAVADALDAMTSARAHRQPMTLEQALEQVREQAGRQFDPEVVNAAFCLTDVISEPATVSPRASAEQERADDASPEREATGELSLL